MAAWRAITGTRVPRRLVLSGPAGAGKTHLASIWGEATAAVSLAAIDLTEQRQPQLLEAPAVVVEDVDGLAALPGPARRQVETLMFHLFNLAVAGDRGLLLTGRTGPGHWAIEIPDLASRVASLPHVAIAEPDDTLLSAILLKLLKDRQLTAGPDVIPFLLRRMERSFATAEALVDRLDRLALARRRPVTRHLARELFQEAAADAPQNGDH